MREHETTYPCMPHGPVRINDTGASCYFCGIHDPDESHLGTHAVSQCCGRYGEVRSYTRRVNLLNHLRTSHGVLDGSALADEWQETNKNGKNFFSCGFCVSCFSTITEQISHIDTEHWTRRQELSDWSCNNVILGLLSRPGLREAWQGLMVKCQLSLNPQPDFCWDRTMIGDLQLKLEQSRDSAEVLAELAFTQSAYYKNLQPDIGLDGTGDPTERQKDNGGMPLEAEHGLGVVRVVQTPVIRSDHCPSTPIRRCQHIGALGYIPHRWTSNVDNSRLQLSSLLPGRTQVSEILHEPMPTAIQEDDIVAANQPNPIVQSTDPWNRTSSAVAAENTFNRPWTVFTPLEPQNNGTHLQSQSPVDPANGWSGDFDIDYSSLTMTTSTQESSGQFDQDAQSFRVFDTYQMDTPPSSFGDTLASVSSGSAQACQTSPNLVVRLNRKPSRSRIRGYDDEADAVPEVEVNTGQRSRYRYHDDHLRRKRRVNEITDYES